MDTPLNKNGEFEETHKTDKVIHGFGHISIEKVVKKYGGNLQYYFDKEKSVFHSIILLSDVYSEDGNNVI